MSQRKYDLAVALWIVSGGTPSVALTRQREILQSKDAQGPFSSHHRDEHNTGDDTMTQRTTPLCIALVLLSAAPFAAAEDPRNITTGRMIPDEGYCDQPYVVITQDGNWLCTLTTGPGHEGQGGQHVVSTISTDQGKTWSPLVDIEPADGPEASWVVPLVVPGGRVYAFYTYNGDRVDRCPAARRRSAPTCSAGTATSTPTTTAAPGPSSATGCRCA